MRSLPWASAQAAENAADDGDAVRMPTGGCGGATGSVVAGLALAMRSGRAATSAVSGGRPSEAEGVRYVAPVDPPAGDSGTAFVLPTSAGEGTAGMPLGGGSVGSADDAAAAGASNVAPTAGPPRGASTTGFEGWATSGDDAGPAAGCGPPISTCGGAGGGVNGGAVSAAATGSCIPGDGPFCTTE